MTKILILSVSAGAGHMRAAEALRHAAAAIDGVTAEHWDVMDFVPNTFRKIYTDFYIALVNKAPHLWSYLYQITNDAPPKSPMQKLRRGVERLNTRPLLKAIREYAPEIIICTHFLPAEILSRLIGLERFALPVWVQVTDFDLHRLWVHPNVTGYFVANEEVAFRLQAQGTSTDRIQVTGIPIMPAFSQRLDRASCARELNLDPQQTTILLMGGGAGLGSMETIAERLLAIGTNYQLIALAGKNAATLASLQKLAAAYPGRLLAQGFTNQVERLMACADFVITKPGGLTTSECLAMGLPMIVNSPIPGQEERNADFLLEQGAALKAMDLVTLEYRVRLLLDHPAKLVEMRKKANALGRPQAASEVIRHILQHHAHA